MRSYLYDDDGDDDNFLIKYFSCKMDMVPACIKAFQQPELLQVGNANHLMLMAFKKQKLLY